MGCCESTTRQPLSSSLLPLPQLQPTSDHQIKGASSIVEVEEKVKEVLCETPATAKPKLLPSQEPPHKHETLPPKTGQVMELPWSPVTNAAADDLKSAPLAQEASTAVKATGSITSAKAAGNGGAQQRRAERSPVKPRPSGSRSFSGELVTGKSPTRIRPDGIGGSVRIVQSRDMASSAQRLDPGERSWRRSGPGSPGKRTSINGGARLATDRTPSMRRTDLSPSRVKRDPSGSSKRMSGTGGHNPKQQRSSSTKGRESLESPLVSLECFIFL